MNINQTINHCLGLSYFELENFAGKNFMKVYDHVKAVSRVNPNDVLIPTIFTCIAADGSLSQGEWDFIAYFIGGYTYEQALATAGEFYCQEAQDVVANFIASFPYDIKEAYINMCLAVLAVDGRISNYESCFLNNIL